MLQLGVSKVDITPRRAAPLAGFAHRQGPFASVAAPLFARCFWFADDGARPVLLVTADLIWWGAGITASIRARFPGVCVVLTATHTHSGPQTATEFAPVLGLAPADYLADLEEWIVAAALEAKGNCEPVRVFAGTVDVALGIHRRKFVDGVMQMAPNPDGPTDPACTLVRFMGANGAAKAQLVHATCHPTTTDALAVSSEFCGHAMARLESAFGCVSGFLQGFCGDVRPALVRDGAFYRGGQEEVRELGDVLAGAVEGLPLEELTRAVLGSFVVAVAVPFEDPQFAPVTAEMSCVQLAQGLALLTCNAEMVVAYGLFAKQCGWLPVGYTNGMIGYVPTAQQLEEGGYEARGAFPYFHMPAAFAAEAEGRIRAAMEDAAKRGFGGALRPL